MKIYTKNGDAGYTTNFLGEKHLKCDGLMELQGSIDEVNAHIGVLRSKLYKLPQYQKLQSSDELLKNIQFNLYEIGVELSSNFTKLLIDEKGIKTLENNIDEMTNSMPPLKNFLYYTGIEEAVYCHVIRTVVRRAERNFVRFNEERKVEHYSISYKYINRLSDFFFTLARFVNHVCDAKEEIMFLDK